MWNNESVLAGQCAQWIERAPVKAICTSRSLMQPGAPVAAIPRAQGCASAENDVSPFELLPQILGQFIAGGGLVRRQGCMEAVASDGGAVGGHGWPAASVCSVPVPSRIFHRAGREAPVWEPRGAGEVGWRRRRRRQTCSSSVGVAGRNSTSHPIRKRAS
jgi:hypothetical protein